MYLCQRTCKQWVIHLWEFYLHSDLPQFMSTTGLDGLDFLLFSSLFETQKHLLSLLPTYDIF